MPKFGYPLVLIVLSYCSLAFSQEKISPANQDSRDFAQTKIADFCTGTELCAFSQTPWSASKVPFSPRPFPVENAYAKVSFSPSSELLAGSSGNFVVIWNIKNNDIAKLPGHRDRVNSVAFCPQGDRLISASKDKTAKIWNVAEESVMMTLTGHEDDVLAASFSSDGKQVITADQRGIAKVWDAESGELLFSLPRMQGAIYAAAFSPDGLCIVTGGGDRICRVWAVGAMKEVIRFTQHSSAVASASFHPNGDSIVSTAFDGTAFVWSPRNGQVRFPLKGVKPEIVSAVYSSDGGYIFTGGSDGSVGIWDANRGDLIQKMRRHNGKVYAASNKSASMIATVDEAGGGLLWDAKNTADEVIVHGFGRISNPDLRLSSDGQRLVVDVFREKLSVINTMTGKLMSSIQWNQGMGTGYNDNPISPDGRRFAKLEQQNNGLYDLVIRDVDSGKVLTSLKGHGTKPSFAFSNRGTRVITLNQFAICFWNGDTGKMIWEKERKSMEGYLLSNSLSSDGTRLVTRDGDILRLWDSENGTLLHNFSQSSSSEVAFSSDSSVLVTTHSNFIHVWDVSTGVELQKIKTQERMARG